MTQSYPNYFQIHDILIPTTFTPIPTTFAPIPSTSPLIISTLISTPIITTFRFNSSKSDTSESDNSNNFSELDYNDTDDEFVIPLEWPPSRPMVNYPNDTELEEDYKTVGNGNEY